MSDHRQQPEGASRQAVGVLVGALIGFFISARRIFADFGQAGSFPWVESLGMTVAGAFVGLIVASLSGGGEPPPEAPPDAEPARPEQAPGAAEPDQRIRPDDGERQGPGGR
jgi:hypothetical protein